MWFSVLWLFGTLFFTSLILDKLLVAQEALLYALPQVLYKRLKQTLLKDELLLAIYFLIDRIKIRVAN
jgi:hypothetical protein